LKSLVRARYVRIYERDDTLTILTDRDAQRLTGPSAALARAVLDYLRVPRTRDAIVAHVAELSGDAAPDRVVDEMVSLLTKLRVVCDDEAAPPRTEGPRVVLALGGGIVAAHAPALTELLLGRGYRMRVAATPSAMRFVRALPLEALTHEPVVRGMWPRDRREVVPHIALARWADITIVYPATATTISRIARGDCSTVVSALAISTRTPVILVPAMNEAMFTAPSVQRNLTQLRDDGFVIMHPSLGYEVAEDPHSRTPAFGAAPTLQAVVDVTASVLGAAR
jgi:hypothetical protein